MDGLIKLLARIAPVPGFARLMQGLSYIVVVAGLLGTGLWLYQAIPLREQHFQEYLGRIGVGLLGGAAWLAFFSRLGDFFGQRARDLRAKALFQRLSQGQAAGEAYTLYLRPFASTDAIRKEVMMAQSWIGAGAQVASLGGTVDFELEAQLEKALRSIGPLVALGQPLEHVGAGRIAVTEETWKDAVMLLAKGARLIVLLPSARAGTLWEIDHLFESGLAGRTVILDAPNAERGGRFDQSQEWAQLREAFAARGYEAPKDSPVGAMVFYGAMKAPQLTARLDIDAEENIQRFVRRVGKLIG
jgi:hypothetical protein